MTNDDLTSTSKSIFGWKGIIASFVVGGIFMALLYLAVSNEPDYMPNQQRKLQQQEQMNSDAPQPASSSQHSH